MRTRLAIALAVAVVLTGCGATNRDADRDGPTLFPARQFALDVTTLDPCDALGAEDRDRLDVRTTKPGRSQNNASRDCTWSTRDGLGYTLQTFDVSAEEAFETGNSEIVDVAGVGAVQRRASAPGTGLPLCQLVLDVADAASLRAQLQVTPPGQADTSDGRRDICDRLRDDTARMLENLRAAQTT
ncbi:DUF3558 family protein [Pseudonocardia alni]|uniref:Uncharacterized protein DUF3558 n=1 Tax=Pseudonocardia alni TaxID=33907 RepID=A0AA44ULU4_PSEA5|nr:DUF3558 family protein [Pseudonocardia alni]PKB29847.1 uncharacterized protein DUF3558 [Pseudonocardia alni]